MCGRFYRGVANQAPPNYRLSREGIQVVRRWNCVGLRAELRNTSEKREYEDQGIFGICVLEKKERRSEFGDVDGSGFTNPLFTT